VIYNTFYCDSILELSTTALVSNAMSTIVEKIKKINLEPSPHGHWGKKGVAFLIHSKVMNVSLFR
jgi:hypothetical protein